LLNLEKYHLNIIFLLLDNLVSKKIYSQNGEVKWVKFKFGSYIYNIMSLTTELVSQKLLKFYFNLSKTEKHGESIILPANLQTNIINQQRKLTILYT
jgi:hypothetical protein